MKKKITVNITYYDSGNIESIIIDGSHDLHKSYEIFGDKTYRITYKDGEYDTDRNGEE